jgi:uncharacterized membrane-anchored protein YhcB (DUF1043 family)
LEKRNKYLIIIIIILVIAIGIVSFFAYQNYRMSQMDKLMSQTPSIGISYTEKFNETNTLVNETPEDYNKVYSNMNEMINEINQVKSIQATAYQSADGSYKDLITLYLKQDDLYINMINLWSSRVQYIQQQNMFQTNQIIKEEDDNNNEITKNGNDISTFLVTHPDIKNHVVKYWNYTDS